MKRFALIGMCVAGLAVGLMGCNWETGNDATNWSSAYNWVNFSGTYRSAAGGLLVTDYTTTPSTPGSTNTLTAANEAQGSFVLGQTAFSGKLKNGNVAPKSVVITLYDAAGVVIKSFADDGNQVLGTSEGTINYVSGAWNITLSILTPAQSAGTIRASYSYLVSNSGSAGSGARPGSTGSIYSFNVVQQGQHLTFTDNNGATYTGVIGELRTASGTERTDEVDRFMPVDGDTMIATFTCSGVSAAMMQVKIVGSLQGTVASGVFTGRTLSGTWIELGGKTGDINGQTTTVPIVTTATDTATDTATETAATE